MTNFNLDSIPRIQLCLLPTPIVPLTRLSTHLGGVKVFIKRDDLTGVAFGGNKNRKLEFLLADAKRKKADVIVTEGALQSNHCLQTAACSAKLGFECELVLSGNIPEFITGNLLLDQILDVKIHRAKDSFERKELMVLVEEELKDKGKRPYMIPTGGSTDIGALGYLKCIVELERQSKDLGIIFDYFVHSTGSGGTQSGVLIGKELYYPELEILGISEGESKQKLRKKVKEIIENFNNIRGLNLVIGDDKIKIYEEYFGEGYGIPNQEMIETVKLVARLEGVFLDPVYTGKAMVGLIDLVKTEVIPKDKNVLFLHSGGSTSIFNYYNVFQKE
ncbi:MAG: D-cysteine desulfhydrase family protein [Candidatus Heimdallarchaeota archaeon]|nr:MAG: D-cysteine desulfhydrase family protein [Candidatus Heimdallarchaeota archaeon]